MANEIIEPNFIIIEEDSDTEDIESIKESHPRIPRIQGRPRKEQRCIHVFGRGKNAGENCPYASISGYYTCYAHCKKLEKEEYNRNVKGWTDADFERMSDYNRTHAKSGMRRTRAKQKSL
jgi:hypothetical protein